MKTKKLSLSMGTVWVVISCTTSLGRTAVPGELDEGLAAYYADSLHGRSTASGEPYDKEALTAAHKTLPFGTVVRVTSLVNRRSVVVRINDRGPFAGQHRIIDLSRKAAERLDMIRAGVIGVRIEIVSTPDETS